MTRYCKHIIVHCSLGGKTVNVLTDLQRTCHHRYDYCDGACPFFDEERYSCSSPYRKDVNPFVPLHISHVFESGICFFQKNMLQSVILCIC